VADTAKLQFAGIKLLEIDANADANHRIAILRDGINALNKATINIKRQFNRKVSYF
jgi:hypothetical protein